MFNWKHYLKCNSTTLGGLMQEMLRPIPVALASCTRFFEAMSAMRDSFAMLQNLRVGHSSSLPVAPSTDPSQRILGDSDCVTPPWRTESRLEDLASRSSGKSDVDRREGGNENSEGGENNQVDGTSHRRLSWPPSVKQNGL